MNRVTLFILLFFFQVQTLNFKEFLEKKMLKCEGVKHPSKMISVESEVNHEVKQAIELHIESNVVVGDVNKGQNPYNKQDNRHAGSFVNIFFDSITKYT